MKSQNSPRKQRFKTVITMQALNLQTVNTDCKNSKRKFLQANHTESLQLCKYSCNALNEDNIMDFYIQKYYSFYLEWYYCYEMSLFSFLFVFSSFYTSTESFLLRQLCDILTSWSTKIGIAQCDPYNGDNYILVCHHPLYLFQYLLIPKFSLEQKKCFKKSNSPSCI